MDGNAKGILAVLLVLLASNFATAASQNFYSSWFPVQCTAPTPPICTTESFSPTYLSSDVDVTPTIAPSATVICAQGSVGFSVSANDRWNTLALDGGTTHGALNENQLIGVSTVDPRPYQLKWVSPTQSNSMFNYGPGAGFSQGRILNWKSSANQWATFVSSNGLGGYPEFDVGLKYKQVGQNGYFSTQYQAYVALFCNVKASLTFGGTQLFNQDYLGTPLTASANNLGVGTYSATSEVTIQRCLATIKDDISGTTLNKYVVITVPQGTFQPFDATPVTVTVENPFTCSLAANGATYSPNPAPPSSQITFSFNLANNGNKPVRVGSIALASGSPFSNLAITSPPIPFIVNNGASQLVQGTVNAPNSPGTYQLKLDINSQSTTADCATGAIADCNASALFIVDVNVGGGTTPDYIPIPSATGTLIGQPFTANIITYNQGDGTAIPSRTRVRFNGGAFIFYNVPGLAQNTQQLNTQSFTCPSTPGTYQLEEWVDIDGAIPEGTAGEANNYASIPVACSAPPPAVSCVLASDHGLYYQIGQSGSYNATCKDIQGIPTNCPALTWGSTRGSMSPGSTPPQPPVPVSVFTAGSNGVGTVQATSSSFSCSSPVEVIPDLKPDYVISGITAPSTVYLGERFDSKVSTKNIGTLAATVNSITVASFPPQLLNLDVPPLAIGQVGTGNANFACQPLGANGVYATADAVGGDPIFHNIIEIREDNNDCSQTGTCRSMTCWAIPNTCTLEFFTSGGGTGSGPGVTTFGPNDVSGVKASCFAAGSPTLCPNFTWSQTAIGGSIFPIFTPRQLNPTSTLTLNNAPDQTGREVRATSVDPTVPGLTCSEPFDVVTNTPVSCVLASDHGPNYLIGQSGSYNATCKNIQGILTNCPSLAWSSTRGSMNPGSTPPQPPVPASTFTAGSLGTGTIQASSVGITPSFSCTPPVTVNVIPDQKPDYIISSILAPSTVYLGERFDSKVSTKNIGTLAATVNSITVARFTPQLLNLDVPPLGINNVSTGNANFACQPLGTASVTASADAIGGDPVFHNIFELNENNNDGTSLPITCYAIPNTCTLEFFTSGGGTGSGPGVTTFGPNDVSGVKASCFAAGSPTLCPNFTWSQTAIGGSIFPIFTPRQLNPTSTLTLVSALPQTGREVRATSVDPTVPGLTCSKPFDVSGTSPLQLSCSLVNHGPVFFSGESAQVMADCLLNGAPNCPALNWNTNLRSASMNPLSTPAGRSPKFSTFSVGTVTANANGSITISCADPTVCGTTSCSIDVGVFLTPNSLLCSIENHSNIFTSVDSATIRGECFALSRNPTACPDLAWTTNITRSSLVPTNTPAMVRPATLFSTRGSPPQSGFIDARSTDIRFPLLRCNPAINASVVSSIGPDYTATVQTSPIIIPIGDIVHIKVKTSNIGNAPGGATSFTSTVITPADCSPPTSRGILPLNPGDTNTLPFDCPCTTPGVHNIVSEADSTRVIADPDRTNNIGTATYYCAGSQVFACSDYV